MTITITVIRFLPSCARVPPVDNVVFRRKKRDTSSSETDTDEDLLPPGAIDPPESPDVPGPEGLHPNDPWPTPSGITLDMANSSCVTPIHSLSIFETCDKYTKETRKAVIDSCILDIQVGSYTSNTTLLCTLI